MKKWFSKLGLAVTVAVVLVATLWHRVPAWVFGAEAPAPIAFTSLQVDGQITADHPVRLVLQLSDADVRVRSVKAVLTSPDGLDTEPVTFSRQKNLGQWVAQVRLPNPAQPGNWTVNSLQVVDDTGATTNLMGQSSMAVAASAAPVQLVQTVHVHPGPFHETQILPITLTATGAQPLQSVDLFLRGPNGQKSSQSMLLGGGATVPVEVPLRLPKGFGAGTWHLQLIRATAADGSVQNLYAGQDFPGDLKVVKGRQDTQPPTIQNVNLSANTLAAGSALTINAAVTDDLSGVAGVYARLVDAKGRDQGSLVLNPTDSGTYTGQITVPSYAPASQWSVHVQASDVAGNVAVEQAVTLQITAAQTNVAPAALNTVALQWLTNSLLVQAQTSGDVPVTEGIAKLQGPAYMEPAYVWLSRQNDGALQGSLPLADQTPSGTWTLTQFQLIDAVGQNHVYQAKDLPSGPITTTVTNANADNDPPVFDSITVPAVVAHGGRIRISLAAHDAGSGIESAHVTLHGPQDQYLYVDLQWNADTQQWVGSVPAPNSAGEWHVQSVHLKAASGNAVFVQSGTGFDQAIQVRG